VPSARTNASSATGHVLDGRIDHHRRSERNQTQRRLRDVDGVVADTFEVAGDLDGADQESKVACHRLLQGEQLEGELLDLHLQLVNLTVPAEYGVRLLLVPGEQRVHRDVDEFFRTRRHVEQTLLERCQLVVEVAKADGLAWGHPNLPVMYASVRSSRGLVKRRSVASCSISWPR
jgi:hypothetical protein